MSSEESDVGDCLFKKEIPWRSKKFLIFFLNFLMEEFLFDIFHPVNKFQAGRL